jgi:para-aminobenzoate synthetase
MKRMRLVEYQISSDAGTLAIYEQLYRKRQNSFWLDTNALRDSHGWSFMGAMEAAGDYKITVTGTTVTTTTGDGSTATREVASVWKYLREALYQYRVADGLQSQSPFKGGYVGYLGYGIQTSAITVAHAAERIPDLALLFCTRWLAVDHRSGSILACALCADDERDQVESWAASVATALKSAQASVSGQERPTQVEDARLAATLRDAALDTPEQYEDKVRQCIDKIKDGESYEICLTTGFEGPTLTDPFAVYRILRSVNPAPNVT